MRQNSLNAETDALIDQFLEGAPRAQQWTHLRQTLEERLQAVRDEYDLADARGRERLTKRLRDLEQQVKVLREEEAITQFVEDTVRATLARPHPLEVQIDE